MAGFASRLLDAALEDGDMRGPLSGMFPADLPVPSFASALAPLIGKLPKVEPNVGQLAKMAWRKAGSIQSQFPSLSRDECAAITLYTMEDIPRERSPYYVMNAALREKNRQVVKPWRDFVWLMLHALRKLPPSKARIVVRGSRGTASQLGISSLTEGTEVQWSAFSSTATKVDVMAIFLDDPDEENADTSGPRTMIHLELTEPIGRDVSAFSLHPGECEVLLPPNICFEVVSHYDAGSGLLMVQYSLRISREYGKLGFRIVPAAGPSSVAGPARPSWPARLPTREDRARGQNLAKSPCLSTLHGDFTAERVGSATHRLHQRVRLAILYGIDPWYIFSIARGEELRPFSTCVRRCRTMFDIVEHDRVTAFTAVY